jgi:predicted RNA binding protein YcfA (HicA-like mRNA interferase family)
MKVREVIELIEEDGWIKVTQRGSHRQFKHSSKPGKVTVPGKLSSEIRKGTLKSILKQAGIEV